MNVTLCENKYYSVPTVIIREAVLLYLNRISLGIIKLCVILGEDEEAARADVYIDPHKLKPTTCFHPRDFTGTAGMERGRSLCVCPFVGWGQMGQGSVGCKRGSTQVHCQIAVDKRQRA